MGDMLTKNRDIYLNLYSNLTQFSKDLTLLRVDPELTNIMNLLG